MDRIIFTNTPTVSIEEFLPQLAIMFPDVNLGLLEEAVRVAAIDFCKTTKVIEDEIKITLYCDGYEYLLEHDSCLQVYYIRGYKFCEDQSLQPPRNFKGVFKFSPPRTLQVGCPPQDGESDLYIGVSLIPRVDACELPEILNSLFSQAIIDGATAFLLRMPGKKWSDMRSSLYFTQMFQNAKGRASVDRVLGNNMGPHRISLRD